MIYEEVDIKRSVGKRLLTDIRLDIGTLYRGHVVTEEDVLLFQIMGLKRICVAIAEEGDVDIKEAREIIATQLCGKDTAFTIGEDGIISVSAMTEGYFISDTNRVIKFNRNNKNIFLNIIKPYTKVERGDVIARIELITPLYNGEEVGKLVLSLAGNVDLLSVLKPKKIRAGIIYSKFYNDKEERQHFADIIAKLSSKLKDIEFEAVNEYWADFDKNSMADAIQDALEAANDVTVILPSPKIMGQACVVLSAMQMVADEVFAGRVPQTNINDVIVAVHKNKRIISLPYEYAYQTDDEIIDEIILTSMLNEKVSKQDYDFNSKILMRDKFKMTAEELDKATVAHDKVMIKDLNIAAVILAAGISSRMGKNKLLLEVNGETIIKKTVRETLASDISSIYVVTGYQSDEVEEELDEFDINIVNNISYRGGVKTSIRLGLSHVPTYCDGVIIILADMPNVTSSHINNMIKAFDKRKKKQVIISAYKGTKQNPVLWANGMFRYADIIPEGSDVRPVLVEFEDDSKLVEVNDQLELLDVNFPADFEIYKKSIK